MSLYSGKSEAFTPLKGNGPLLVGIIQGFPSVFYFFVGFYCLSVLHFLGG